MEEIKEYLKSEYPEIKISEMIDEEISEWVDRDDSNFEGDEYEWYQEYCNGEAEDAVRANIKQDIANKFPSAMIAYPNHIDSLIRQHNELLDV